MATELFANNPATTLAGGINSAVTTLTVASSTGFPAAATGVSQFRVIIGTELLLVTNVSGTTWTVTRGAESTVAAAHLLGAAVTHVVTAAALVTSVQVTEAPLDVRRYYSGTVIPGTTDVSSFVQAAVNALPGNSSLGGGTVRFAEAAYINAPITINKAGVRLAGDGGYTTYLTAGSGLAASTMFTYAATSTVLRGVRLDDLAIDMLNVSAHAIEMQGAYDNCQLSNVWIRGIHKDKSGFRFIPAPGAVTDISQTIIVDNCMAVRNTGATACTQPLFKIETVHEAHFRGCKAIGAGIGDSGIGFKVHGHSQLVKFDTCSASNTNVGWDIRSDSLVDYVERIIVDSPLFETINTGVLIVGTAGNKVYRCALRTPRLHGAMTNVVDAEYSVLGVFEVDNQASIMRTGSTQNRVFADDYRISNNLRVNTALTPAVSTSLNVGVNTTGVSGFPGLKQVQVGAADSGGVGYRLLRVTN
jgi:hypothetical protein